MSNKNNDIEDQLKNEQIRNKLEEKYKQKNLEYKKLYDKSFILKDQRKKRNDLEESELDQLISKINQQQNEKQKQHDFSFSQQYMNYFIKNNIELVTNLTIESICILVCYPFNTIKTRIQSKHPYEDVSYFIKNNVAQQTLYRGISQGILSTTVGIFFNNIFYRWFNLEMRKYKFFNELSNFKKQLISFCFADMFATPFRLPFEVRKMLIQMNSGPISFSKYMNSMKMAILPSILRDFSFRLGFNSTYQCCIQGQNYMNYYQNNDETQRQLIRLNIEKGQANYDKKITGMILGSLVGILISNPFDFITTRLITQQYNKYTGFSNCFKTVIKEEGYGKLALSGSWPRTCYYLISGSIIFNFYETMRDLIEDAYSL